VTDILLLPKASSKCFLVISGTGSHFPSYYAALGFIFLALIILYSASIASLTAALAAF